MPGPTSSAARAYPQIAVAAPDAAGVDAFDELSLQWLTPVPPAGPGTVVATGVFDILHVGHLRFLRAARAAGMRLVVGIEDDARTRARKGGARPIVPAAERGEMLAALDPVDAVFLISGPVALPPADAYARLLAQIGPSRLAFTAGDPAAAGRRTVAAALGCEVVEVAPVAGRSTTVIVESFIPR
jgi:cytidyltransferase-like protein